MKPRIAHRARQAGVTLVELLVAMTIGLVITIAALAMLILGRGSFEAVDSTSQLMDRERFAMDIINRVVSQAGYQEFATTNLLTRQISNLLGTEPEPDVFGWNNALYVAPNTLAISGNTTMTNGSRSTGCGTVTDTSCLNGSDVLVVRFQGSGAPTADGTMVNCRGESEPGVTANLNERAISIFYTARDAGTGEPALMCAYYNHTTSAWVAGSALVDGVESFQVLYGTDNVTPGVAPGALGDTIVDRWLRADQLTVPSNAIGTRENWRRVRAVRVGLVLRGAPGSAQERVTETLNPLGNAYTDNTNDVGTALTVAADGRLRRVATFTIHIRNDLTTR